ncbi:sigma factor-like helix-turn-helix DNA-binding protein [Alkalicoccobacillus porphyridii]|nr:sigma factor-like helix-turn-helix DNA-binding protein [Alkalicoccobacillus porphyridii]
MVNTWVDNIIRSCSVTKKELESYRKQLDQGDAVEKDEFDIVGGMISDLVYSMDWLSRGRRPGNRRGIERQAIYKRTALLDMNLFPSMNMEDDREKPIDDKDKRAMIDILWTLSNRERESYVLHMSYGMSYAEIAAELKVGRTTVQKYVERAKKKVLENI